VDDGLWLERDQAGLVPVDALVVSGIDSAGFLRWKRKVSEALAGAHLSGAQDQVVGVDLADGVAVL